MKRQKKPNAELVRDLVAASHILFNEGVVDGFGHVSARDDRDPGRFLLSRSIAPGMVTASDIMEFDQSEAARLGTITFLNEQEAARAAATIDGVVDRPWELWKRRARK
jgi:ribulose-5-phosphate 4-epimerase/fuculose-1-phosphate aldolase